MPCPDAGLGAQTVINVPITYELVLEDGLTAVDATNILRSSVDHAIAKYSANYFDTDCSKGILSVWPGYTDYIDSTAPPCKNGGNCYPCRGYVVAKYDPSILDAPAATSTVHESIAHGMDSSVGRSGASALLIADDIPGVLSIGIPFDSISVGGVRQEQGSSKRTLSPGGKAGIIILCLTLVAFLALVINRRRSRKAEWKERKESMADDYNRDKLEIMKELDGVVASIDSNNSPEDAIEYPPRTPGSKKGQEEGFEISIS